jgi:hypothetical protein
MSLIQDFLEEAQRLKNNIPQLNDTSEEIELDLESAKNIYSFVGRVKYSCDIYYGNQNGEITSFNDIDEDGRKLYNLIFDWADLIA